MKNYLINFIARSLIDQPRQMQWNVSTHTERERENIEGVRGSEADCFLIEIL